MAKAQEESIQAFDEREKDKLVPFTCYDIDKGEDLDEEVTLKTQFERVDVKIKGPGFLCVPTIIKKARDNDDYAARDDDDDDDDNNDEILEGLHLKCFNINIKDDYDHDFHAKVYLGSKVAKGIEDHKERKVRVEKEKLVCLVTKKTKVFNDDK